MNEQERHVFWLVVAVLVAYLAVPLAGTTACLVYAGDIVVGRFRCDQDNRLVEMLNQSLTAVLALWAGMKKGP